MIVPLPHLLSKAQEGGYALGYFEAWDSYSLETVIEAAEAENAPVIVGFGCMMVSETWLDRGGIEILGNIGLTLAERTHLPVALLLNEAHTYQQCITGIQAGFNAVMLDTSTWQVESATEQVRELVTAAHAQYVAVEAELGHLPDATNHGIDTSLASLTDAREASLFVEQTGIDCLAVSIGNVHLLTHSAAQIDLTRLAAIHERTSVPLVIHGGTGFPPESIPVAIRCGVAKFNVGTSLKKSFFNALHESVLTTDDAANVHDIVGSHREQDFLLAGKRSMQAKVQEYLRLYGSSGHARSL
ncbi:MAG: class II fructose-bisphosphate aldolase [Ktedonobacteraceae bacterium]